MESGSFNLAWCTAAQSPYNDDFFNAISNHLGDQFSVFYASSLPTHPWKDAKEASFVATTLGDMTASLAFLRRIVKGEFDAVVFGGWGTPVYMAGIVVSVLFRRKFFLFTDAPRIVNRKRNIREWARRIWLRFAFSFARGVFGTGSMAVERLRVMGVPANKIINLPYGLDEGRFQVKTSSKSRSSIGVLSSGRLALIKGYDLSLRAFASVAKELDSDVIVHYQLAGSGECEETLHQLMKTLDLSGRVEFMGWQSQEELAKLFAANDFFLHPARFEPYGVAVVEALYSGLFVIASDETGAAVELVQPGLNGVLFQSGSLACLETAIRTVLRSHLVEPLDRAAIREASLKWPLSRCVEIALASCRR